MSILKRLARTLSYVTCMPLYTVPEDEAASLGGLSKYLPAAGVLIGFCLVCTAWLLQAVHANNVLRGLLVGLTWLALTGGLHFDGLMDTADGIFSHRNRQRMIEIMADSRTGNFGVMVGFSILLLKVVCLMNIPDMVLNAVLMLVPAWARWCETYAIGKFTYVKESGKGKIWHDSTRYPIDIVQAACLPGILTAITCMYGGRQSALIAAFTICSGLMAAFWLNHKLGGHTGDTYGSVVELAETGALLATALCLPIRT